MVKSERKKELEKKIRELEEKLSKLAVNLEKDGAKKTGWMQPDNERIRFDHERRDSERRELAIGSSPVGVDKIETIRELVKARDNSESKAGLTKTTEDGSVQADDDVEPTFPTESIHDFNNTLECTCDCHPKKRDCQHCYDHPVHLDMKRQRMMPPPPPDEYDEKKILELIDADKAKKGKKSLWEKLKEL